MRNFQINVPEQDQAATTHQKRTGKLDTDIESTLNNYPGNYFTRRMLTSWSGSSISEDNIVDTRRLDDFVLDRKMLSRITSGCLQTKHVPNGPSSARRLCRVEVRSSRIEIKSDERIQIGSITLRVGSADQVRLCHFDGAEQT